MKNQKIRSMKVHEQSGYNYKATTLCKVLTDEVTGSFQGKIKVFDTRIPTTVKVGESIYYNMPIAQYSKKASAGIAYRKFAKEIIAYEG